MQKDTRKIETIARSCIAVRLRRLNRVVTNIYDDALRPLGLKVSQLNILIVAARLKVARPAKVCEILQLDGSTLSRNVERTGFTRKKDRSESMLSERTQTAKNFTCLHAGPMDAWGQFKMKRPEVPIPVKGKLFLRNVLGSAGMEMSLNVVPPGDGIPFLHKHKLNEEVYVVVGGRGQFLVDGECIDVEEGSVLRVGAAGERAYRNNSDAPLYFLCIQYRAASAIEGGAQDGQGVEAKLVWPD